MSAILVSTLARANVIIPDPIAKHVAPPKSVTRLLNASFMNVDIFLLVGEVEKKSSSVRVYTCEVKKNP